MGPILLQATAVLLGIALAGEALAIFAGMRLLGGTKLPPPSPKNISLLGTDLAVGLGLLALALAGSADTAGTGFHGIIALGLASHGYREWEYLARRDGRFCVNLPLFALNNLKLAGLLLAAAVVLGPS